MSDQQAPTPDVDSPAVAGPDEASGAAQDQAEVDWQKRYLDTQADYSRGQQALKEQRQWLDLLVTSDDANSQRQALEALGYDVPEEVEDVEPAEYEDPYESLVQRQERLEQRLAQQDQQAQAAMEDDFITGYAHEQLDQMGIPREDIETRQMIFERALSLPNLRPSPGMPAGWLPDMKTAHEQFEAWENNRMKSWAKTKRAPFVSSGGRDATEAPDPGTGHQARMNRAMLFLRNNAGDNE